MFPDGGLALAGSNLLFRGLPAKSKFSAEEKRELKQFTLVLKERVAENRSFTCLITEDRELQRLNRKFLGHDYPTDVLSFPSGEQDGELGEIAISIERAEAQAAEYGHNRLHELRVLMLHGVLHLTGMDHETDGGEMACAEKRWRTILELPLTLIARTRRSRGASRQ